MKKSIKILSAILCACMLLSLASCGAAENNAVPGGQVPSAQTNQADQKELYPERDIPSEIPPAGEDAVQIHYQREDNKYSGWTLWLWDPEGDDDGLEDDFNYQDEYGAVACYPLSKFGKLTGNRLGIIVKTKGSWTKDGTDADRFIEFGNLSKDENGFYHIYLAGGDEHMYKTADKIITDSIESAVFRNERSIRVNCSNAAESYKVYEDGRLIAEGSGAGRSTFSMDIPSPADFTKKYSVEITFRESKETLSSDVGLTGLYSSDSFNDAYFYDGQLGAIYSRSSTVFRVWSPVSSKIILRIYDSGMPTSVSSSKGSDAHTDHEMIKADKGVFEYKADGDLGGKYYTYVVYSAQYPDGAEITDPYARSTGANGLRGMVVDPSKASPEGWNRVSYLKTDRNALTVWETHVADITTSKTWTGTEALRGKYLGAAERGTSYTEGETTVKTGFDHIVELGVNAVQLQPVFDHANNELKGDYNWGYNPLNYNVPEGQYASSAEDGYARIRELKQLIAEFNKEGISVIMDVVYNHVNGAAGSNFDVLMPGYYFRYNLDGSFSNGSGCGNETASEHLMMRKFIVDSVCYWTEEYKLGGFRFDLMGLHDIETMNEVAAAAKKINPNIVIYGEPWTGGATPLESSKQAIQANANSFEGYGQFNDQMRDALIKGGLNPKEATGWVTGSASTNAEISAIIAGINGITASSAYTINDVNKTVNYVTCHDNYTLWDRCIAAGISDTETVRKMCVLANSVVFTSRGTGFMLAGEEMLRTKGGDSNSYQSPNPVNSLDYSLKIKYPEVFETYRKLIAFKQSTPALANTDPAIEVSSLDGGAVLCFTLDGGYMVLHCNGAGGSTAIDTGDRSVVLDTLGKLSGKPGSIVPEPYQTIILK